MVLMLYDVINDLNRIPIANKGDDYKNLVSPQVRRILETKLEETYIGMKEYYGISWEKQHE